MCQHDGHTGINVFVNILQFVEFAIVEGIDLSKVAILLQCIHNMQKIYKLQDFEVIFWLLEPPLIPINVDLKSVGVLLNKIHASSQIIFMQVHS